MSSKTEYTVLIDTGEQQPWTFQRSRKANLYTGDYTLEGLETDFIIERKGKLSEFSKNITEARFERELVRMEDFALSFLVLEFTMEDIMAFPEGSGIPKQQWASLRITPRFILKRMFEIDIKYKTKIILAGAYGTDVARSLFNRAIEWKQKRS